MFVIASWNGRYLRKFSGFQFWQDFEILVIFLVVVFAFISIYECTISNREKWKILPPKFFEYSKNLLYYKSCCFTKKNYQRILILPFNSFGWNSGLKNIWNQMSLRIRNFGRISGKIFCWSSGRNAFRSSGQKLIGILIWFLVIILIRILMRFIIWILVGNPVRKADLFYEK